MPAQFQMIKSVALELVDVRDGDRDHAHVDPLAKCEILSTNMPIAERTAASVFAG